MFLSCYASPLPEQACWGRPEAPQPRDQQKLLAKQVLHNSPLGPVRMRGSAVGSQGPSGIAPAAGGDATVDLAMEADRVTIPIIRRVCFIVLLSLDHAVFSRRSRGGPPKT